MKKDELIQRLWAWPRIVYLLLPFVALIFLAGKPFHIDDVLYLRIGDILPYQVIGTHTGRVEFLGEIYQQLSPYESTHPPLIPFFMKLIGLFVPQGHHGFWQYHLAFLIFPLLMLFSSRQFAKARKIGVQWLWFLLLSPAFFVNATNLMTDVPMVCMWVICLQQMILFHEKNKPKSGYLAATALFTALMISYQSLCLVPLMILFALIQGTKHRAMALLVGIPCAIYLLFLLAVYSVSGFFPFLASTIDYNISVEIKNGLGLGHYLHKSIGTLTNLGLALAIPLPLLLRAVNRRRLLEHLIFASVLSFTLFHLANGKGVFEGYSNVEITTVRALLVIGSIWSFQVMSKFVDGFRLLMRNRTRASYLLLFSFWFLGVFAYNVLFLPYSTSRYILPAVPAALLLLFSHPIFFVFRRRDVITIVLAGGVSLFMALVDYRQAEADFIIYRDIAAQHTPDQRLWFSDDAGLNRYLNSLGASYLSKHQDTIGVGDQLLLTRGLVHPRITDALSPIREWRIPSLAGCTLFDTNHRAGFYRSYDGLLPIARSAVARKATLYQANYFMMKMDEAETVLSNPNYFGRRTFELPDGTKVGALFMHPDAIATYPLRQKGGFLSGATLTNPADWNKEGDGVRFEIGFREQGEAIRWVWAQDMDGKNRPEHRQPVAFNMVIPPTATAVAFKVSAGALGDYRYDGAGWLNLMIKEHD